MNFTAKEKAIFASARNVCGPKSGEPAKPSTVLESYPRERLHEWTCSYYEIAQSGHDCIASVAEIGEAATKLERSFSGGGR